MAKKTSRFGSNVIANVEKRKRDSSGFGYLTLTKGLSVFKEEEGKMKLDIIPYIVSDTHHLDRDSDNEFAANPGNPWYKKPVWVHRSVGADKQSVICPAKTIGKKCPICEYREKQRAEGVEKDDQVAYPQLRNLYVVIPVGSKKFEEKFHIWDIANGNFQKVLDEELAEKPENGVFPDPEEGKTLVVRFTEEKFGKNKYYETSRIDFEDRDAYDESIMEKAPKLDEMVKIHTYKELEAMFLELGDDDEDDKPAKKKVVEDDDDEEEEVSTLRKKKTVKVEEEEEEEEEEEVKPRKKKVIEEDDDSPFEAPRKKKSIKNEEEQEEDEEEATPAPRKRKPAVDEDDDEATPTLRKRKPVEEEEDDEQEEESTPLKKKESSVGKDKCPNGHVFGKDWEDFDDCDGCPLFNECGKANEKLRK
jgi:hypothetical protein